MVVRQLFIAAAALVAASSVSLVRAQVTSNATCESQYSWMTNSKGQTPCLASGYLSAQCNDGQWNVPAIGTEGPYNHPTGAAANICRCNTVVYNLLSACSICQGGNAGNWVNWVSNCSSNLIAVASYPLPLPAGVAIPSWAYIDFTQQDMFQVEVAHQYATAATAPPESMSGPAQTQPFTYTTSMTRSSTAVSTQLPSALPATGNGGGSSNTGAIVGGVVGGVLGIAVLCLIAVILIRKKKQQQQTENVPSEKLGSQAQLNAGYPVQQQPYNGHYASVPVQSGLYNEGYAQPYGAPETPGNGFRQYDPSDPSTFPATPAPGGHAPTIYSQGPTEYSNHSRPGQYNYGPEL